ncbi:MAG: dTDP-glucose 4,6-dehydratase [Candidatus Bathyarchaeota archaeon]
MRLLVTGGLGFIGSNFIKYILNKDTDFEIINLDSLSYGSNPANLKNIEKKASYRIVKGSITDENLIKSIIKEVDAVINFAAETHVDRSISDPEPFLLSNTLGTFTLLEAARKADIKRFLQVSTDEIYGTAYGIQSFKEGQTLNPSNPYSASKAAADMYVTAYHRTYGLQTVITRSTNNFGPYQFPEKFIPKTIIRALKNVPVPIYGSGKQTRSWIHVTDHCRALESVLHKGRPGEIYNISTKNEIENLKVAHNILQLLHKQKKLIHFVEDRPGHDLRYSLDSSKIRSELDWEPKLSFSQALKSTVKWYQNNEWWWKPIAKEEILHSTPWKSGTTQ